MMHGGDLFIVLIVAIVMIAGVMKAGIRQGRGPLFHYHNEGDAQVKAETLRLREEVAELKERIKVLERIAVEKENSLAKQIEELRDR